jgi:hypothetical protein
MEGRPPARPLAGETHHRSTDPARAEHHGQKVGRETNLMILAKNFNGKLTSKQTAACSDPKLNPGVA